MNTLSTEQISTLSKYEPQFKTAVYSKYLRAQPTSYYADFIRICKELGVHINLSCSSCMFNAVSTVGKAYYDAISKATIQTMQEKTPEPVQMPPKTPKSRTNKTTNKTKKKA